MTAEEVAEIFKPSDEAVAAVRQWLESAGISEHRVTHSDNKGWLAFDATTEEAESLLHTEYHAYEHTKQDASATACEKYHLPKHIQQHVDYVTPGVKLLAPVKRGYEESRHRKRGMNVSGEGPNDPPKIRYTKKPDNLTLANCDKAITPDCISALYKVPKGTKANPNNTMGVFEEGDYYAQEDLNLFYANFTKNIPKGTHPIPAFIDGAQAPVPLADAGGESDLDFMLAYPILWPQQT